MDVDRSHSSLLRETLGGPQKYGIVCISPIPFSTMRAAWIS